MIFGFRAGSVARVAMACFLPAAAAASNAQPSITFAVPKESVAVTPLDLSEDAPSAPSVLYYQHGSLDSDYVLVVFERGYGTQLTSSFFKTVIPRLQHLIDQNVLAVIAIPRQVGTPSSVVGSCLTNENLRWRLHRQQHIHSFNNPRPTAQLGVDEIYEAAHDLPNLSTPGCQNVTSVLRRHVYPRGIVGVGNPLTNATREAAPDEATRMFLQSMYAIGRAVKTPNQAGYELTLNVLGGIREFPVAKLTDHPVASQALYEAITNYIDTNGDAH